MRFEDERYVRLYTRDTTNWSMLPWQSRFVLMSLLRTVDRAGILDLGEDGAEGLAVMLKMPFEVVEAGMPELLRRETLVWRGSCLFWPKFMEAQEARQSDKARQRASRERARDRALAPSDVPARSERATTPPVAHASVTPAGGTGERVTPGDESVVQAPTVGVAVQRVTDGDTSSLVESNRDGASHDVTDGHARTDVVTPRSGSSHDVTPYCAVPSHAVLTPTQPPCTVDDDARAPRGGDTRGSNIGGAAARRPLPSSELPLNGAFWRVAYEDAVAATLEHAWRMPSDRAAMTTLASIIGDHCSDRARITEWIADVIPRFVRAVQPVATIYSGYAPRGLERWFNLGCPERVWESQAARATPSGNARVARLWKAGGGVLPELDEAGAKR